MAAKDIKIALILSASDKASAVINRLNKNAKKSFDAAKKSALIGTGIAGLLAYPIKAAADMEKMNVALRTSFQGNEAAATKAFKTINKFAADTPYELEEVMRGFIKLKNMGLDPSQNALTAYGNTASAMGKSLNDMVEAVADAATGEFERLKEFGIRASSEKDKVTFTFQGVKTTVGKNSKEIEAYLKKLGNTKFAGGISAQSKTFNGQLSTLKDNATQLVAKFGEKLLPAINRIMQRVSRIIDAVSKWTEQNAGLTETITKIILGGALLSYTISGLALITGGYFKIVRTGIGVYKALRLGMLAYQRAKLAGAMGMGAFSKALAAMNLTALPWILLVAAIAGAAYLIYKNWDPIKAWFSRLWSSVVKFFSNAWQSIKNIFFKALDIGKFLFLNFTPHGLIIKHWGSIIKFFSGIWENIKRVFFSFVRWFIGLHLTFFNAGKNIVMSIWNGISAFASKPIEAIKNMVKKIRDFLPFSPAKVGPLKDIHRIKLVETIADSIKPNAMVKAMSKVALATSVVGISPKYKSGTTISPSNTGGNTIHFSPVINLHGSATKADGQNIASQLKTEFEKLMRDYQSKNKRLAY